MNDLEVCWWPTEKPIPYARNSRKIPPGAIDKVAASLKEFGWRQPIVVDKDGVIICGHTRLLAAKKLGWKQVPIHVAANLTPAQVKAYRLMDNRPHEEADWDTDLLGPELEDLRDLDFDLSLTGFEPAEIDDFLADPNADDRQRGAACSRESGQQTRGPMALRSSSRACAAMPPVRTPSCGCWATAGPFWWSATLHTALN